MRAFREGVLVSEVFTGTGSFELPLEVGSYDVQIAVDGAFLERLDSVVVEEAKGLRIRRSPLGLLTADRAFVYFKADVTLEEQGEILAAGGMELGILGISSVAIRLDNQHIEVVLQALVANNPDTVTGYEVWIAQCAGI